MMQSRIATSVAALALCGATLPGCDKQNEKIMHQGYRQIDPNTFFIEGPSFKSQEIFATNLARFRAENPGEFYIIFANQRFPGSDGATAIRKEVMDREGANQIYFVEPSNLK